MYYWVAFSLYFFMKNGYLSSFILFFGYFEALGIDGNLGTGGSCLPKLGITQLVIIYFFICILFWFDSRVARDFWSTKANVYIDALICT